MVGGAFGGRKGSEDFAGCDADGFGRARGLARPQLSPADIKKLEAAMREKACARLVFARSHKIVSPTHDARSRARRRPSFQDCLLCGPSCNVGYCTFPTWPI
jgi:hypothetical protein